AQIDDDGDGIFEQIILAGNEFTGEDYLSNIPKWLKEKTREALEEVKTGDKHVDKKIDDVLKYMEKSLAPGLWIDNTHLNPRKGKKVFHYEGQAVSRLNAYLPPNKLSKRHKLPEQVQSVFVQAIADLIKTDKILVQIAINEARSTPVNDQKYQRKFNKIIKQVEATINKADKHKKKNFRSVINHCSQAWELAQKAIRYATK
ncbi:unnamed protein product, partial [marine sediment metagenome]